MLDLILRGLIALMIFLSLFAMGMSLTLAELGAALRRTRLLALGLALNFLALPAIMLLLLKLLAIDGPVAAGLLLCVLAPGNGIGTLFVERARGDVGLSVGLVLALTLASVALTPILLGMWTGGGIRAAFGATTWPMMKLILVFQLLPLAAGLLLRRYAESLARRSQPLVARAARGLVLVVVAAYLVTRGELFLANGVAPLGASVAAILASFAFGWTLPRSTRDERVSFGITSMIRNLALALLLATTFFPDPATIAAMLVYALLMFIVGFALAAGLRRAAAVS